LEELKDYAGDYLREEIAAEGYARNLDAFARFLSIAATCQAAEVNFERVASDCQVPARTVREYFHILEDTLIGTLLKPFSGTTRRKAVSRSKFFLFDVGVHNALTGTGFGERVDALLGTQMESIVFQELKAALSYARDDRPLTYWRTQGGGFEVDFVIGDDVAIEVKSTRSSVDSDLKGLRALGEECPMRRRLLVSRDPLRRVSSDGIEWIPFGDFTTELWQGGL
jgi:predicted AAA+ superfamily ATPase